MSRICVVVLFLLPCTLPAQEIAWKVIDDPDQVAASVSLPARADSLTGNALQKILTDLHYEGYLTASYGLNQTRDSLWDGTLYIGSQYRWATLDAGNVPEVILSRAGFRTRDFREKPFRLEEMQRLFKRVIRYSENHGFPFAAIWIDSVRIEHESVGGVLSYDPGPAIEFDSLQLQGYTDIRTRWLMSYLDVVPGSVFEQQALSQVPQRIRRLPFVRMGGEPVLTFQNEAARLYLPLEKVASNRIDGVVGFLPNEENDGGIRITGQFDLSLTNLFNSGKQLDVAWQRVKPLSQTLALRYRHPNILRSPVHFDGGFELLKEDSTFINRQFRLAFAFTSGIQEIGVFSRFKSSRLLTTGQYKEADELPGLSDQNVNYYGLQYEASRISDGWSDNKGWRIGLEGALGDKKIRRSVDIPDSLYENIDLRTLQVTAELEAAFGIQAGKRSLFYSRLHAGFIDDDRLFLNDLFRLGGLRSLRGFTENNYFASSFAVMTLEYQLFFETFSYLFLFADQGLVVNDLAGTRTDYPTGFGFGLNLRTGGGDLQLAYALGRTRDQPVNFSLSKFHFGYVAKF